jgi:transketolase
MRNAFSQEMTRLAGSDESIVLLSADMGNRLFNPYKDRYPDRFYNCGVAEANMISMAAGMAMCGLKPVTYTIAAFNTLRCYEQIKIDVCYANLPVVIVGVGAGLSYASNGVTHESCEDIALLRALPNMTVLCPADSWEVRGCVGQALDLGAPTYIRLGKKNEPLVHKSEPAFHVGRAHVLRPGTDVCLLSTGTIAPAVIDAADLLSDRGISCEVVSFHTVKPLDEEYLSNAFTRFGLVVTAEEHSILGGFGGSIAEWVCDQGHFSARLLRLGTGDSFLHEAGGQEFARAHFGLTAESIATHVLQMYQTLPGGDGK